MQTIQTVGVVVFSGESVLLVKHLAGAKHLDDTFGLPAGRIQHNETDLEAARRELKEETGLFVKAENLVKLATTYQAEIKQKDSSRKFTMVVFKTNEFSGQLQDSDETQPVWINVQELNGLNLLPNVETAIQQALSIKK